jgi:hypothetical protein
VSSYRQALDDGVEDTPEWELRIAVANDVGATREPWQAVLQDGMSHVLLQWIAAQGG